MPKISLVVCLHKERDFLERLLAAARDCYDDLVVVHDGPEEGLRSGCATTDRKENGWKSPEELSLAAADAPPEALARDYAQMDRDSPMPTGYRRVDSSPARESIHETVARYGGRFYEGPRCFQQEPHWPFAWWASRYNWLLRLDADEFPSPGMVEWIRNFRAITQEPLNCSGFTCIWPLWNGHKATTFRWPVGRLFLFDRRQASFVGAPEMVPNVEGRVIETDLTLCHQPRRKSYGVRNILIRPQARVWRRVLTQSLLRSPQTHPRWRYTRADWPGSWPAVVSDPLVEGTYRALKFPLQQFRNMRSHGERFSASACINPALHHFMIGIEAWRQSGFPMPRFACRRLAKKALINAATGGVLPTRTSLTTLGDICPWTLDLSMLTRESKVISGGVGGDISFELDLHRHSGCEIALLDPSPTGRSTIEQLRPLPKGISFHPIALAGIRGTRRFAEPLDAKEGSFREPRQGAAALLEWPCVGLEDFLSDQGWTAPDLLKLDIEGFEFEVLLSMLASHLRPKQLLVEFHYGKNESHSFWQYLAVLVRLRNAGYALAHRNKGDHLFLRTR